MTHRYDAIVLGTGNAGQAAARVIRKSGRSVAIVECRDKVGGTCPLRGCVPKKVLVAAAEVMDTIHSAGEHAISVTAPRLDWASLIAREKSFIANKPGQFVAALGKQGIELLHGKAVFLGARKVEVDGTPYAADNIVVATGSIPRPLVFEGARHVVDNETILSDPELPASIAFIGGGVISLEFAHVYGRAGSEVTILESSPRILSPVDADVAERLRAATEKAGVAILTGVEVTAIALEGNRFAVRFRRDGGEHSLHVDRVAHGAGRVPAVEALDLEAAGIEHDGPRIAVTEHLASASNPRVYVAGDAHAGSPQLSPIATYEGEIVGCNIVEGNVAVADYRPVPAVVYSLPPLATVGLSEEEANERGVAVDVKETDMAEWFSSRLYVDDAAYAKVLIEPASRRIVGAHLVGKRAEEIIHLFAFAIGFGISADDMAGFVYAFPTFSHNVASLV